MLRAKTSEGNQGVSERNLEQLVSASLHLEDSSSNNTNPEDNGNMPRKPIHPSHISTAGVVLAAASLASSYAFADTSLNIIAPSLYLGSMLCDFLDGCYARAAGLTTVEGSIVDPLCDKLKNLIIGVSNVADSLASYPKAAASLYLAAAYLASFAVDYKSQKERGSFSGQIKCFFNSVLKPEITNHDNNKRSRLRANYFGKLKTAIQNFAHLSYIVSVSYASQLSDYFKLSTENFEKASYVFVGSLISISLAFGVSGIVKRVKK